MKPNIQKKLDIMKTRLLDVQTALSQPACIQDQNLFQKHSKTFAELEPVVSAYNDWLALQTQYEGLQVMQAEEKDPEMTQMMLAERKDLAAKLEAQLHAIHVLLLPKDPNDARSAYLEIRAGTGGHEAALFAGDLYRMYSRFGEQKRWQFETISISEGEQGGYKEIIVLVKGKDVYGTLKFESGTHRVQRVPTTESQGRIHTSACTVAIMPEVEEIDDIDIQSSDLRIDTFRASGAGGQHVNTTDSAVRITHLPTGVVVECQDERSQHKNKARAMKLLQSRLLQAQVAEQQQEMAAKRKSLVGSGDRSERIRTYNFPQGRITDHRINLTLYRLNEILEGTLADLTEPLREEYNASLMVMLDDADA